MTPHRTEIGHRVGRADRGGDVHVDVLAGGLAGPVPQDEVDVEGGVQTCRDVVDQLLGGKGDHDAHGMEAIPTVAPAGPRPQGHPPPAD
ncbi:hypothetical protein AXH35_09860 [Acidipropionibacterium acidipropionici]|uniref:Uncharacterized protein n=1 Tax=Acidipropionibacterium acidipropionici TaxID=1748 RepID=A0AAC8YFE9_9ACTN|nr:hypothetical protein AXH35_09860 [Acidipropionibacterium acidipropionici]